MQISLDSGNFTLEGEEILRENRIDPIARASSVASKWGPVQDCMTFYGIETQPTGWRLARYVKLGRTVGPSKNTHLANKYMHQQ
ncbi:predicted protein [Sclerotinia sclerotiorum 1980 UF-70]|uniref:Uncharacterized protein n=1 Tax=Sclerotinia sclerotiorum (strain ATCC 18683 / 1980 / Ss-1) TaxID=665079 RepID=A7E7Y6_SCLS1|nr:predicted protein [Sclerotinia sclerotiorum 1980 UF-70]EDN96488.1 predicted protein [Sclerotinia sclerotiorum 1980 UF-70]